MATKSYSKHKEFKEYSSSSRGNVEPFAGEQFDMMKSELIPKGSKLDSLGRDGQGHREYHYEYKEEKHPSGKYDRKDLHTVEEYTIPPKTTPKAKESSSYYYEREERELPAITSGTRTYNYESSSSSTPGYSKVKSSKVTKDLSHNVEELDSLLDDLQKDQERQLYKSGYASDTAESTSFDYKRGTPAKAPSSGYSTLKREERLESSTWGASPPPATTPTPTITRATEMKHEMFREEKTESRVVPSQISPALPIPVPPTQCLNCHQSNTSTLTRSSTPMNKVTTTVKTYTYEVPADTQVPLHETSYLSSTDHMHSSTHNKLVSPGSAPAPPGPPGVGGCLYCSHCNSSSTHTHLTSTDERTNERMIYPTASNETKLVSSETRNGLTPHGPTHFKYSETTYSAHNSTERYPSSPSPAPFPRPTTPSPAQQQPPKKLDDLLADFPEARFPTQPDGVIQRKVEVSKESYKDSTRPVTSPSRNVAGPAVYYPPGHTPFEKKEGYQASAAQGGGAYASGRGMYEYESGAKSKEKHSEKKTAVPICLPLCCAMPCVIM